MKNQFMIVAAIAFSFPAFAANAQDTNVHKQQFHAFFSPLLEGEWIYHSRMTDEDGDVLFDGTDIRQYSFGVRGNFLIENVFQEDENGGRTHIAIQLIGLDTGTGEVHWSSYWPWQATKIADASGEIQLEANGAYKLTATARPARQDFPVFSLMCQMENTDAYKCTTSAKASDGTDYTSNVETFTRRVKK